MAAERWEGIRALVAELGRAEVRAGVVGPKAAEIHKDSDLTLGELAILHEFGNEDRGGHLPERSFVRKTLRDPAFQSEFGALQARLVAQVIAGSLGRDEALRAMGQFAADWIRKTIRDGEVRPDDAPSTVARKGHDVVLIESGELAEAIGFEIRK